MNPNATVIKPFTVAIGPFAVANIEVGTRVEVMRACKNHFHIELAVGHGIGSTIVSQDQIELDKVEFKPNATANRPFLLMATDDVGVYTRVGKGEKVHAEPTGDVGVIRITMVREGREYYGSGERDAVTLFEDEAKAQAPVKPLAPALNASITRDAVLMIDGSNEVIELWAGTRAHAVPSATFPGFYSVTVEGIGNPVIVPDMMIKLDPKAEPEPKNEAYFAVVDMETVVSLGLHPDFDSADEHLTTLKVQGGTQIYSEAGLRTLASNIIEAFDKLETFEDTTSMLEGWLITDDVKPQLQTCDLSKFDHDQAAWVHVYQKAQAGSSYHQYALDFMKRRNPEEHVEIIKQGANASKNK